VKTNVKNLANRLHSTFFESKWGRRSDDARRLA